jgi:hypothetical protein
MAKAKKASGALLDIFTPKGKSTLPDSTIQQIEEIVTQGALPVEPKVTAAERAAAGRAAAKMIEEQEQTRMSEALGELNVEGFGKLSTSQADRTRVGGGNIGGGAFPAISLADPRYKGKTWGVKDYGTASRLTNLTSPSTIWSTMLGSENQLMTNPIVFAKLEKQFKDSMKAGNLTDELAGKINQNLQLFMGEGADIRDPKIWKELDTFEKRAMMANLMMGQGLSPQKGGVALGGEKSGKGVIFRPTETLIRETEPSLLHPEHGGDVPTFAIGPRLFTLEKDVSFRPDLHPGFPTLIHGVDKGYNVRPVPNEIALPDWHKRFQEVTGGTRKPGYYDLALGLKGEGLPSQLITEEFLTKLQKAGYADGGMVESPTQEAIADTVQNPNAARMLEMDLANLALTQQPQRMAGGGLPKMLRVMHGSPTKIKATNERPLHVTTDPLYATKRGSDKLDQMGMEGPPMVNRYDIPEDKLLRMDETMYSPETINLMRRYWNRIPADKGMTGEEIYDLLSANKQPFDRLLPGISQAGGFLGYQRPATGTGGRDEWFKIMRPESLEVVKKKGGAVKRPSPEEMRIEMMERGYGKR